MSSTAAPSAMTLRLEPQPGPQWSFLATPADIALYGGAAGGGKSFALLLDAATWTQESGYTAALFRREHVQHFRPGGLWMEAEQMYAALGGVPNHGDYTWTWTHKDPQTGTQTQAVIKFAHLAHEKTKLTWQGSQLAFLGFDELTHFTETQFWYMSSRARSQCGIRPYIRATTNPDPDSWVRKLIDWYIGPDGYPLPERAGKLRWFLRVQGELVWADSPEELIARFPRKNIEHCKSFTFIPALLSDNPILMRKDPSYEGWLESLSPAEAEALARGNWNARSASTAFTATSLARMLSTEPVTWGVHLLAFDAGGRKNPAGFVVVRIATDIAGRMRLGIVKARRWWGPITALLAEVVREFQEHGCAAMACDSYDALLVGQLQERLGSEYVHITPGSDEKLYRWFEVLQDLAEEGSLYAPAHLTALHQDLRAARVEGRELILPEYEPPTRDTDTPKNALIHCDCLDALLRLVPHLGQWAAAPRSPDRVPMPWDAAEDDD